MIFFKSKNGFICSNGQMSVMENFLGKDKMAELKESGFYEEKKETPALEELVHNGLRATAVQLYKEQNNCSLREAFDYINNHFER